MPEWPARNPEHETYMEFGPTLAVGKRLCAEQPELMAEDLGEAPRGRFPRHGGRVSHTTCSDNR